MRHSSATFALVSAVLVHARPQPANWLWDVEPVTISVPSATEAAVVGSGEPAGSDFSTDVDDSSDPNFDEAYASLIPSDSSETPATSTTADSGILSTTGTDSSATSATTASGDDEERHGYSGSTSATATSTSTELPAPSPPPIVKPPGGQGFNTTPTYQAKSEFDTASLYLGLHQELIELDLFRVAIANFTDAQFDAAGLGAADRALLAFMAEQEVGHAQLISNMIDVDTESPRNCTYAYPAFGSVRDFIDFSRLVTRWGEGGTIGFLGHLDAQDSAALINDAIQTEGRQQMIFRQWEGLFPMPFWFTTSITQSMQWTLLAPYVATCPADTPRVEWTAFPALNVTNNPSLLGLNQTAAVSSNETVVAATGREVVLSWDAPGATTGWNESYVTKTFATGPPLWAAWISQLNTTYTALTNVDLEARTAMTLQPGGGVYGNGTAPLLNGTIYVVLTDEDVVVTPYNLSQIESHIVAGPALYNVG